MMSKPFRTLLALWAAIVVVTVTLFWVFEKHGESWTAAVVRRSPHYYFESGLKAMAEYRYADAEAAFRQAIHLEPRNTGYWRHLGLTLSFQGQFPEAIAAFEEAIRRLPEYLKSRPDYDRSELLSYYRMDLARQYERLGQYEDAIIHAEDAYVLTASADLRASNLATLCRILHGGRAWDKLLGRSREGLEIRPGDPLYIYYRANALLDSGGDLAEAERRATSATQSVNAESRTFVLLARIRDARGDRAGALEAWRSAVDRESGNPELLAEAYRFARTGDVAADADGFLDALRALAASSREAERILAEVEAEGVRDPEGARDAPRSADDQADVEGADGPEAIPDSP